MCAPPRPLPIRAPAHTRTRAGSEQAESGLRFLGLVIFENKLKAGTAPAIQALRAAHLACRMITGDNALTAVSVARECGLVNQTAHVFAPAFVRGACRGHRVAIERAGGCVLLTRVVVVV